MGILGLLPGATGSVQVGDREVGRWPSYRRAKAGLAYVPSGARCFANLTVLENLEVAARRPPSGEGWTRERVYGIFPKLDELKGNMAAGLSGGERQMLAVGRALMGTPAVCLMDEPTAGLARVVDESIGRLMLARTQTGGGSGAGWGQRPKVGRRRSNWRQR